MDILVEKYAMYYSTKTKLWFYVHKQFSKIPILLIRYLAYLENGILEKG
jgi:hypothetical protein